MAADNKC